jgi:hypothetical protein
MLCQYRVAHVRFVVRTRVMCQAGRARGVEAAPRGGAFDWLCARAPLWVIARVRALLRDEIAPDSVRT